MSFKENLKVLRENSGISSAKQFAAMLEIPYSTYIGYETEGREPKYDVLCSIASLLGVSVDTLLGHDSDSFETATGILKSCGLDINVDNDGCVHIQDDTHDFCKYDNLNDFKEAVLSMHKAFNNSELRKEAEHNFILAQIAKKR